MNQYRQGDVFVCKAEIPTDAIEVPSENGLHILAHGEATGHCHAISSTHTKMLTLKRVMYLRVLQEVMLRHDEHAPIALPPGDYLVRRQREYTPKGLRNVAD